MQQIITDRHKLLVYVLYEEFDRSQQQIADLFEVSQPTVSLALKDARKMVKIRNLEEELEEVRTELRALEAGGEDLDAIDIDEI